MRSCYLSKLNLMGESTLDGRLLNVTKENIGKIFACERA